MGSANSGEDGCACGEVRYKVAADRVTVLRGTPETVLTPSAIGTLDNAADFPPVAHIFTSTRPLRSTGLQNA